MRYSLLLIFSAVVANAATAAKDIPVKWSIYPGYADTTSLPGSSVSLTSAIAGDGLVLAADGSSVYSDRALDRLSRGVQASIKATTNDAVLTVDSPRSLKLNLAGFLGTDYITLPQNVKLDLKVLNVANLLQYQLDGCVFYTVLKSDIVGSDGKAYNLPMRNLGVDVYWPPPAAANCPYLNSRIRVEFHKAGSKGYVRNTWFIFPELQTSLAPGSLPGPTFGSSGPACPSLSTPGTVGAPAAVAAIRLMTDDSYNFGQYHVPFYFKLEQ